MNALRFARPYASALAALSLLLFVLSNPAISQVSSPAGAPILFVHGYCGDPDSWGYVSPVGGVSIEQAAFSKLQGIFGSTLYPGTSLDSYTGFVNNAGRGVVFQHSDTGGSLLTPPTTARLFRIAFQDPSQNDATDYKTFNKLLVASVPIFDKANELFQVLKQIEVVTRVPQVIIVAHSMGGLVARAYGENLGYYTELSHTPGQTSDIAFAVNIDTPNTGASSALIALDIFTECAQSEDGNELATGSSTLSTINYANGQTPDLPIFTRSVISYDPAFFNFPYDSQNDGVVELGSQNLANALPTLPAALHKESYNIFNTIPSDYYCQYTNGEILHSIQCLGTQSQTQQIVETDFKSRAKLSLFGNFTKTGTLTTPREWHTASLLSNGQVLIAGGAPTTTRLVTNSAELFNPKAGISGTWSATGSMSTGRAYHTSTKLSDGTVLVTGGYSSIGSLVYGIDTAETYSTKTASFTPTKSAMTTGRAFHTATLLNDGTVLITGGEDGPQGYGVVTLASAELYNPTTKTFSATGSMSVARDHHTATLLKDGTVLITGGCSQICLYGSQNLNTAEIYNPATHVFTPVPGLMTTVRTFHSATLLNDGRVMIAGGLLGNGYGGPNPALSSAELYDPATQTFTAVGNMTDERYGQTASVLKSGKVLVVGGANNYTSTLQSAELFDPATLEFTYTWLPFLPRTNHTATALSGGSPILITSDTYGETFK